MYWVDKQLKLSLLVIAGLIVGFVVLWPIWNVLILLPQELSTRIAS